MKWNEITSIEQALHLKQTQPEAFAQMLKEADLSFDYLAEAVCICFKSAECFAIIQIRLCWDSLWKFVKEKRY